MQPIRDEDLWWHELIGSEILATRSVSGLGNSWAPLGDQGWTTTQWLSEVLYAVAVAAGGWQAVIVLRVLVAALTLGGLFVALFPRNNPRAAVVVYLITVAGTALWLSRDRPQTLTLPLTLLLAAWLQGALTGRLPRWYWVGAVTLLWSSLHGSWVLVPAVFLLVTLVDFVQPLPGRRARAAALTLTGGLAGLVNPAGVAGLTAIARFRASTGHILEWGPTPLATTYGVMLLAMVLLHAIAWARSSAVPRDEALVALALIALGLAAIRNVPTAMILLAPITAARLTVVLRPAPPPSPVEERRVRGIATAMMLLAACFALTWAIVAQPTAVGPTTLVAKLATIDPPPRVLNSYELGGLVARFGPPGVEVAIDGRADRYPPDYVDRYLAADDTLRDWRQLLDEVTPDVALLKTDTALARKLRAEGWMSRGEADGYVLLIAP
jgi:hypothetical protein